MKKLSNNCTRTEIWGSPKNWQTTTSKSSLKKSWSVQCDFYDPLFKKEYPKGFPLRRKVNRGLYTIDDRRAAVKFVISEMEKLLDKMRYNPITEKYMEPDVKPVTGKLNPKLNFIEALRINYPTQTVSEGVKKEIRRIIKKIEASAITLEMEFPICEMHSGHVRDLLDHLNLTPNEYNKYLTHLSIVLSDLVEKRMLFHNPIRDIKKKKTTKKLRETLEISELQLIFDHLKVNNYEFFRYGMIFFHSGSRTAEMFRLQEKDVNLRKQEYKLTIKKGNHYKEVIKVILPNVIQYWTELLTESNSTANYLFSIGLKPGEESIQPYQITKRWKRLIKDKMVFKNGLLININELESGDKSFDKITADFYSLKHLFLDELDRLSNSASNLSKTMASHTTNVTETNYLFGREGRKNEALKNLHINVLAG
jgi:site-specific recombinase XerC